MLRWQDAFSPEIGATLWSRNLFLSLQPRTVRLLFFRTKSVSDMFYIVGKSGSGKRTLLFNLALSDIVQGDSVVYSTGHPENLAK